MPKSLFYRGDAKLLEVMMNAACSNPPLENIIEKPTTTIVKGGGGSSKKKTEKKRKIEKSKPTLYRSDQYYKLPFCNHGSFSKLLGIVNTELQFMRSCKDTLIFLLWNDDIYFPSQTLLIIGSLATSIQSKDKNKHKREAICVLELSEEGLVNGQFVKNIELGDGFLIIQTREHTLYGLGDNTINQLGIISSKNQKFYHEIIEIPFEHGQIDFIRCGLSYSVAFTKSKEIYVSGEYDCILPPVVWERYVCFDNLIDPMHNIVACEPASVSMYCITKPTSDMFVHSSYVFDWQLGSIRKSGYFNKLKSLLQQGITIQRIESCQESVMMQLSSGEWFWTHFELTERGSYQEYFVDLKTYIQVPGLTTSQFEIVNVSGNKSGFTFLVVVQILSSDNNYDLSMEPYMIFEIAPNLKQPRIEKIACPLYGRIKWTINAAHTTQYFSLLVVDEEPNELMMKRLLECEKWRDVTIITTTTFNY